MDKQSFPLCWPDGWPRSVTTQPSRFDYYLTVAKACDFLETEVRRLSSDSIRTMILSTNIRPTLRGTPASNVAEPKDRGVAAYFSFHGKQVSLACDKWNKVADNIWAVAKHIEALRGQERWGVGSIERAFRGYMALPERTEASNWWRVLQVAVNATPEQVREAYCRLANEKHPDKGGTDQEMASINLAYEEAQKAMAQ